MEHLSHINQRKKRRVLRVRARIFGTASRPRLAVFRSNAAVYAQLIDDDKGVTLFSARTGKKETKSSKTAQAGQVGKTIAETALKAGIKAVVFDRRSYRYHGRIKALAEAARAAGLQF